jgi:hypothetical protein
LDEIKTLPPDEQREICDHILALTKAAQRAALERLCGAGKGEGLLEKLLADRAKERARG